MAASGRLTYPAGPAWRGPETVLLKAAASVFAASFGVLPIVLIVGGAVSRSRPGVVVGSFCVAVYRALIWHGLQQASRLEFSNRLPSWERRPPWAPRSRPGRVPGIRLPRPP